MWVAIGGILKYFENWTERLTPKLGQSGVAIGYARQEDIFEAAFRKGLFFFKNYSNLMVQ